MTRARSWCGGAGLPLAAAVLLACVTRPAQCVEPIIPDDEYRVLATVLEHGLDDRFEQVVIANTTTGDPASITRNVKDIEELALTLELPPGTLSDWVTKNRRRTVLTSALPMDRAYSLITSEQLFALFAHDDPVTNWSRFFERYPRTPGLLRLSRVGFDRERAHAVVYVEFDCGAVCGAGRLVHLLRDEFDQWQVSSGELIWIAAEEPE